MEVFATDLERLEFLLEAEAEFHLAAEAMSSTGERAGAGVWDQGLS